MLVHVLTEWVYSIWVDFENCVAFSLFGQILILHLARIITQVNFSPCFRLFIKHFAWYWRRQPTELPNVAKSLVVLIHCKNVFCSLFLHFEEQRKVIFQISAQRKDFKSAKMK